jgi:curved DNA-binding protein CbpA
MSGDDPFSLFGIAPDADAAAIRQAYERLSAEHSSDAAMAARLSRALAQLLERDPRGAPAPPSRTASSPPARTTFDDLFRRIYSDGAPAPAPPPAAPAPAPDGGTLDINLVVHCTLEELFGRSVKLLTFVRRREGGDCETRTARITLTDGTEDHTTIALPGQGHRAIARAPGSVLITILQRPHARLTRAGVDLLEPARLSLRDAISGRFELASSGIDGEPVAVRIAETVQNGQELRVPGRGMRRKDGTRGDHVFQIALAIPPLTAEQRARLAEIL